MNAITSLLRAVVPSDCPVLSLLDPAVMSAQETWTTFAPQCHVCDSSFMRSRNPVRLSREAQRFAASQMLREGYFQLPPADWNLPLREMAHIVHRLARIGAPPVLAFHFDEFWMMFARLYPLLCALLGDHPIMLPEFWAWHVDPEQQEAGWAPHRDRGYDSLMPDGRPKIITLWLPLTDTTPLNSCMYIVPADRDPTYGTPQEILHRFNLGDIRALPAQEGAILGWDQAVLHWGSHAAGRQLTPRMSIACEFQRRDVEPYNPQLLDPLDPPAFALRQRLIGQQILRYQHMVDVGSDWKGCAEQMAEGGEA